MFRVLHRWAGVVAALLLVIVSLTGFILSIFPLITADRTAARLDAGSLIVAVQDSLPGVQQINVSDNGVVTATAFGADGLQQIVVDAATGASLGPVTTSGLELWFENLHRNLFLSDTGQLAVLIASVAMVALTISGLALAARRLGGWRKLLSRDHGNGAGGLHLKVARIAAVGLIISSVTGVWMGFATLGVIPDPSPLADMPTVSVEAALPANELAALTSIDGAELRSITLPVEGLSGQAYEVETDAGAGFFDPATGEMLTWTDRSGWSKVMDVVHLLHTGQGASLLGLILGLMSLAVPVLSGSGILVWLAGRGKNIKVANAAAVSADVIVLVGSEGGSTWRFANAFARSVQNAGLTAHLAPMNNFAPQTYSAAKSIVVFAATYGDGDAPESAKDFIAKLAAMENAPKVPLSVLGFGDSSYPDFCGFADEVAREAQAKGWSLLIETGKIDRQSTGEFSNWGCAYAAATGIDLGDVATALERPEMAELTLVSKSVYGEGAQAPTAVLRFAMPKVSLMDRLLGRNFAKFQAGDLLNIIPDGSDSPRSYSLASGTKDDFVEICVRKVPGGLASTQLCSMERGDKLLAYVTPNAHFHAPKDASSLILIGAGAGIGSLAGIVRGNRRKRPAHLFFGMRSRSGGLPYEAEFEQWQGDGRLSELTIALSRSDTPRYVQQALMEEAAKLRNLVQQGAHFMICGGRDMGDGVRAALEEIIAPLGMSVNQLEKEGRYAVDVF